MVETLHGVSLGGQQRRNRYPDWCQWRGKTTLLMTLCGDPRANAGTIRYQEEDHPVQNQRHHAKGYRDRTGRSPYLPALTVEENLQMGGFYATEEQIEERQAHVFQLFPRLKERIEQRAGTMSGGEQQMLYDWPRTDGANRISSSWMSRHLDLPIIINQIFEIISRLREEGVTIFLVEQNANQALKLADRGYVLENGKVVLQDTGRNL